MKRKTKINLPTNNNFSQIVITSQKRMIIKVKMRKMMMITMVEAFCLKIMKKEASQASKETKK